MALSYTATGYYTKSNDNAIPGLNTATFTVFCRWYNVDPGGNSWNSGTLFQACNENTYQKGVWRTALNFSASRKGGFAFIHYFSTTNYDARTNRDYDNDVWHSTAVSFNSGSPSTSAIIYSDGAADTWQSEVTGSGTAATEDGSSASADTFVTAQTLGGTPTGGPGNAAGTATYLADLAVWNYQLNTAVLAALTKGKLSPYRLKTGLVCYYPGFSNTDAKERITRSAITNSAVSNVAHPPVQHSNLRSKVFFSGRLYVVAGIPAPVDDLQMASAWDDPVAKVKRIAPVDDLQMPSTVDDPVAYVSRIATVDDVQMASSVDTVDAYVSSPASVDDVQSASAWDTVSAYVSSPAQVDDLQMASAWDTVGAVVVFPVAIDDVQMASSVDTVIATVSRIGNVTDVQIPSSVDGVSVTASRIASVDDLQMPSAWDTVDATIQGAIPAPIDDVQIPSAWDDVSVSAIRIASVDDTASASTWDTVTAYASRIAAVDDLSMQSAWDTVIAYVGVPGAVDDVGMTSSWDTVGSTIGRYGVVDDVQMLSNWDTVDVITGEPVNDVQMSSTWDTVETTASRISAVDDVQIPSYWDTVGIIDLGALLANPAIQRIIEAIQTELQTAIDSGNLDYMQGENFAILVLGEKPDNDKTRNYKHYQVVVYPDEDAPFREESRLGGNVFREFNIGFTVFRKAPKKSEKRIFSDINDPITGKGVYELLNDVMTELRNNTFNDICERRSANQFPSGPSPSRVGETLSARIDFVFACETLTPLTSEIL